MIRASSVVLYDHVPEARGVYDFPTGGDVREVACDVQSVGRREYYEAKSHGFEPVWVLVLPDYAEYAGETLCFFEDGYYRIIRTYVRSDHRIELTIEKAVSGN